MELQVQPYGLIGIGTCELQVVLPGQIGDTSQIRNDEERHR